MIHQILKPNELNRRKNPLVALRYSMTDKVRTTNHTNWIEIQRIIWINGFGDISDNIYVNLVRFPQ